MKLLKEKEEILFSEENEALSFFQELSANDIWQTVYTKEQKVMPLEKCPILAGEIRKRANIDPSVTDESVLESMEETSLALSIPFSNGMKTFPLGETAFPLLLQRAGFGGSTALSCDRSKPQMEPMAPEVKAEILNSGLSLFKNKALVLIRDEKVRGVFSGDENDYSILPIDELFIALQEELPKTFAGFGFISALASHEAFLVEFELEDGNIESAIKQTLSPTATITDLKIGLRMVSSDIGISGANLHPFIIINGFPKQIGKALSLTHRHKHSVDDFRNNVNSVFSLFKEIETALENAGKQKLKNPEGAFLRVAKEAGMPKKLSCEYANNFITLYPSPTLLDLYWFLYEEYNQYNQGSSLSILTKMDIEEAISRTIYLPLDAIDMPYRWE